MLTPPLFDLGLCGPCVCGAVLAPLVYIRMCRHLYHQHRDCRGGMFFFPFREFSQSCHVLASIVTREKNTGRHRQRFRSNCTHSFSYSFLVRSIHAVIRSRCPSLLHSFCYRESFLPTAFCTLAATSTHVSSTAAWKFSFLFSYTHPE